MASKKPMRVIFTRPSEITTRLSRIRTAKSRFGDFKPFNTHVPCRTLLCLSPRSICGSSGFGPRVSSEGTQRSRDSQAREAGQASRGQETSGKSQAALIRASALNIKPNMQTGLRDAYVLTVNGNIGGLLVVVPREDSEAVFCYTKEDG